MNKYRSFDQQSTALDIETFLASGESILWKAKPQKNAYIANKVFQMLPFALVWLACDSVFLIAFASGDVPTEALLFLVPFFAVHLMPVWIWLSHVITASKHWEGTEYMVTDRRILIKNGFLTQNIVTISYQEIKTVQLRMGIIDRMFHVGDIYIATSSASKPVILDIADPTAVANRLQKIALDMQSDLAYPNALRPESNPGYPTQYNG